MKHELWQDAWVKVDKAISHCTQSTDAIGKIAEHNRQIDAQKI